jgi:hypothetical protein
MDILIDASLMVINALKLVEHASFSFINAHFAPSYPNDWFFLFRPLAHFLVCCNFLVHHTFLIVTFPLFHCIFFLSATCFSQSLFIFVTLIPLYVAHDTSQYFVFSLFSTFFFLFLLFYNFVFLFMSFIS